MRIIAMLLAAALFAAESSPTGGMGYFSKLDLPPAPTPLALDASPLARAFRLRFSADGRMQLMTVSAGNAALLSLAVMSAFVPQVLPRGVADIFRGQGSPGITPGPFQPRTP